MRNLYKSAERVKCGMGAPDSSVLRTMRGLHNGSDAAAHRPSRPAPGKWRAGEVAGWDDPDSDSSKGHR